MASPTLISSGKSGASGSTSPTLNAGTITAGSTVLAFASDTDGNTLSVSGSSGGSYALVGQIGSFNPRLWCFKKENHPGGAETLTFNFSVSADPALSFMQWSPCTVDSASFASANSGSSPWTLSSNALASADSSIVYAASCDAGGVVTYSESTGFTKDQEQNLGDLYWTHATFHKDVSSTAAVGTSLTISTPSAAPTSVKRLIFALTNTGGGGDVTVSATGVSATTAVGSVADALDVAASGVAGTAAVGTATAALSLPVSGVAATAAVGDVTASLQVSAAGVQADTSVGNVAASTDLSVTGVSVTAAAGDVVATPTVDAGGVSAAAAVGDVSADLVVSVTGVEGAASVGDVTVSTGAVVSVTGVEATSAVGDMAVSIQVDVTGVSATTAVGDVTFSSNDISVAATGVEATAVVGDVTAANNNVVVSVTGVSANAAVGDVTPIGGAQTGIRRIWQQLQIAKLEQWERERKEREAAERPLPPSQPASPRVARAPAKSQQVVAASPKRSLAGRPVVVPKPIVTFREPALGAILHDSKIQFSQVRAALEEVYRSAAVTDDEEEMLLLASLE